MKRFSILPGMGKKPSPSKAHHRGEMLKAAQEQDPQPEPRNLNCGHANKVVVCADCGEFIGEFEEA